MRGNDPEQFGARLREALERARPSDADAEASSSNWADADAQSLSASLSPHTNEITGGRERVQWLELHESLPPRTIARLTGKAAVAYLAAVYERRSGTEEAKPRNRARRAERRVAQHVLDALTRSPDLADRLNQVFWESVAVSAAPFMAKDVGDETFSSWSPEQFHKALERYCTENEGFRHTVLATALLL